MTAEGPRYKRVSIKAEGMAREHRAIRADHLKMVQQAVERKAKKKYEPNTALIVAVDDSVPFREKEDVSPLSITSQSRSYCPHFKIRTSCCWRSKGATGFIAAIPSPD